MKVFQISFYTSCPSFLQITTIGELIIMDNCTEEEIADVLHGETVPHVVFLPSAGCQGCVVDNDVVFFDGQHWCSWHPLTGELRKHNGLKSALEQLVEDIKYLIKLRYVDLS